jgi:uncharacterized OsmC-like protein
MTIQFDTAGFKGIGPAALVILSLLCCVNLSVADEVASNPDVEFEPVGLDDPVTYMEMSACGE